MQNQCNDKIALITEFDEFISYGQLNSCVNKVKEHIKTKSLVLILANNDVETITFYLATLMADSTVILSSESVNFQALIELYCPRYIVKRKKAIDLPNHYKVNYNLGEYELGEADVNYDIDSGVALLLSTSGSTGNPKCVKITYKNLLDNTKSIVDSLEIKEADITITTLPFNYTYGLSIINTHLFSGSTVILCNYSIIEKGFWDVFLKYRANNFGGVPYTYEILLKLNLINAKNMKNVRYLTQAGGKLDIAKIKEMINYAEKYGFKFLVMYGQTEATARMSYLPWRYCTQKIGSVGIPIKDGAFEIHDENGFCINQSYKKGELIYKGPNVCLGYSNSYKNLLVYKDDFNGVLCTGDIAYFDDDGFYYIVGRKKKFIKMRGKRISLDDIEEILNTLKYNFIFSGIDEQLYILVKGKYSVKIEKKFLHILKENAGIYRNSVTILFVDEFPRNEFGKILYDINKWDQMYISFKQCTFSENSEHLNPKF